MLQIRTLPNYEVANVIRFNRELIPKEKERGTTVYDTSYYILAIKDDGIYLTADEEFNKKIKDEKVVILEEFNP